MDKRWDFSAGGRARVLLVTAVGTAVTMAIALVSVRYANQFIPPSAGRITWAMAVGLPLLMSIPVFYLFSDKLRQLAIAQKALAVIASQDSLTTCLNRGAFVTLVDAYLNQVKSAQPIEGALLIVDADNFKSINDHHGHANGDLALKIIAERLKSEVRPTDLVGRVGGEEFGVFLPRSTAAHALLVAERIRRTIAQISFNPDGEPAEISVSIGAAVFDAPVSYDYLFRCADKLLYEAKRLGRNRVVHRLVDPLAV